MKKLVIAILLASAFTATALLAQGPPAPPDPATHAERQVKRLTTILSLDASQQQQATTIFTNAAKSASSVHQQLRSAHDSLKAAVKTNNPAGIDKAAATLGNLNAQAIAIRAKADAAFYQILTPDQQSKLDELQSEGPGGFGGPGGPHGHDGPGPMPF
jgi:Spy/CpxP family protein refolding chaperone